MTISRTTIRRARRVAVLLTLPVLVAACGEDDAKDDATTASSTTVAGPATSELNLPTTTMSDADYTATIAAFDDAIAEAGDDFCKIGAAADKLTLGAPTTPDQAKRAYESFAKALSTIADHLPEGSAADPATLKKAAADIVAEGAANGYDPTKFTGAPKAFTDPATLESMSAIAKDLAQKCAPA